MSPSDLRLVLAAVFGIATSIVLVVKARLHPFLALLCGAFTVGLTAGLAIPDIAAAVQKGAGDILGGTGLVVALGLALGAMLQLSRGAESLARCALQLTGVRGAPWGSLLAALLVGLPLFFETGLVLLLPVVAAVAASLVKVQQRDEDKLLLLLPALAGLAIMHGLVPPHPGPLLAVDALKANMGRTIIYGIVIAIPIALVCGPPLARRLAKGVVLSKGVEENNTLSVPAPSAAAALLVVLLPVVLITAGELPNVVPAALAERIGWLKFMASPVLALVLANLVALPLLFGRRLFEEAVQSRVWQHALPPAGAVLLSIGAGGALKQVLITAGLSELLARWATAHAFSPLLLAWLIAVGVRLSTGSATVATITTAGVMAKLVSQSGVAPEWVVLAIGAGSLFFSHVNDPGFWLVRSYLGLSTADTFRTWSLLVTVISVLGLLLVLLGSQLV